MENSYNNFEEMVEKAKKRETKSTEMIIERLRPLILSNIRKSASFLEKEDVFQELCLVAIECIDSFDPKKGSYFLAYVKQAMQYKVWELNKSRVEMLSLDAEDEFGRTLLDNLPEADINLEDIVLSTFQNEALIEAVSKLTQKQQKVIKEYYFLGHRLKEITKKERKHPKASMQLKKRAILALRNKMFLA